MFKIILHFSLMIVSSLTLFILGIGGTCYLRDKFYGRQNGTTFKTN